MNGKKNGNDNEMEKKRWVEEQIQKQRDRQMDR